MGSDHSSPLLPCATEERGDELPAAEKYPSIAGCPAPAIFFGAIEGGNSNGNSSSVVVIVATEAEEPRLGSLFRRLAGGCSVAPAARDDEFRFE
jgi:hypothetical protein